MMLVIGHYKMVWNVWQQEKLITACARVWEVFEALVANCR